MPRRPGHRRILPLLAALFITGLGLYLSANSIWRLFETATFMRTSSTAIAVVEDVRQRPFTSLSEALSHGNLAWGGSTAYQPIVAFTLTDGRRVHMALPDLNSDDYTLYSELEVRVPQQDFTHTRELRHSSLWGGTITDLLIGIICTWLGYILLRIRQRSTQRATAPAPSTTTRRPAEPTSTRTEPKHPAPTEPNSPAPRTPAASTGSRKRTRATSNTTASPSDTPNSTERKPRRKSSSKSKSGTPQRRKRAQNQD